MKLNLPNFLNFLPKALCLCKWVAVVKCVGGNDSILANSVSCIMIHHTFVSALTTSGAPLTLCASSGERVIKIINKYGVVSMN